MKEKIRSFFKMEMPYIIAAIVIVITFQLILSLNYVPSASMETTIMTGDLLIGTRWDKKNVYRYDIMVFIPPDDPDIYYIKRVIGLPGETIVIENGRVTADGQELDDSFIREEMLPNGDGVYVVPEGCYFMLGDNRNHSGDSRFWDEKYVPVENMIAKARFRLFPFTRIGSITYKAPQENI